MIQIQIAVIDCFKCWTFHVFIEGIYLALKSSVTKLCLSFTGSSVYFPVLNCIVRSGVESERSFRYGKSALLSNSFHWNIPKGKPRNLLKTYHSYCNLGWDVPNQSVFSWRLKSFRLVSWAVAAVWITPFQYLVSGQMLVLFPEMTGIVFLFVSRQGRLHFLLSSYLSFGKACASQFTSIARIIHKNTDQHSLYSDNIYFHKWVLSWLPSWVNSILLNEGGTFQKKLWCCVGGSITR